MLEETKTHTKKGQVCLKIPVLYKNLYQQKQQQKKRHLYLSELNLVTTLSRKTVLGFYNRYQNKQKTSVSHRALVTAMSGTVPDIL